ncbi:MAG: ABC transporter permease [Actinomycetota bacterium]
MSSLASRARGFLGPSPPEARTRRAAGFGSAARSVLVTLGPFVVLVAVWWAIKAAFDLSDESLASPADVVGKAVELVRLGMLPVFVSESLRRIALGAGLAVLMGVPVGLVLGLSRYGAPMFEPFLRFFQAVSGIAWLPLAIVWFGFTDTTIQVVILYTALVPIIFNTMMGVRLIPRIYRESFQTMGGGRLRLITDIYIPGALASIVVGLRLGIGYGWRALIAGEMLIGASGIGFMIFEARRFHLIDVILAGMIIIGVLYLIIDRMILAPIERVTVHRWGILRS